MTRFNLANTPLPTVKFRATTIYGEVFIRRFDVARRITDATHDLSEHMAIAARTFEADPYLSRLEVVTGRRGRAMFGRDTRRIY